RSAALTGSALDELTFCGLEVGEVSIVAVVGDISADDGKEPFGASDPLAFADAAESVPHDSWDAEVSAVGVACWVGHGRSLRGLLFPVTHWWCPLEGRCGSPGRVDGM